MDMWTSDIGYQSAGAVVTVRLTGNAANVRLVDSTNLSLARSARAFRGVGGGYDRSPITLVVPSAGRWHVLIDYGGMAGRGTVQVGVRQAAS